MNRAMLHGNLGKDPEYRVTQGGTSILRFSLATKERVKKGNEWTDETEWHRVTVFGKRAESLSRILHKGAEVVIEGRLHTSSYEKNGDTRYSTEIIVDNLEFAGKREDRGDRDQRSFDSQAPRNGNARTPTPPPTQAAPSGGGGAYQSGGGEYGDVDEDSIPF